MATLGEITGKIRGGERFLVGCVQPYLTCAKAFIKFYNLSPLTFFNALIFLRFRVYFILMTDTLTDTTSTFFSLLFYERT